MRRARVSHGQKSRQNERCSALCCLNVNKVSRFFQIFSLHFAAASPQSRSFEKYFVALVRSSRGNDQFSGFFIANPHAQIRSLLRPSHTVEVVLKRKRDEEDFRYVHLDL